MSSLRLSLAVDSAHLEVPLTDFEHLGAELSCRVMERPREVALTSPQGCLVFDRVGPLALLREVIVTDDADALFTVNVLGRLLAAYEGELHAVVETTPPDVYPRQLTVRRGESSHPLFGAIMMPDSRGPTAAQLSEVERLLEEARAHWRRWLEARANRLERPSR